MVGFPASVRVIRICVGELIGTGCLRSLCGLRRLGRLRGVTSSCGLWRGRLSGQSGIARSLGVGDGRFLVLGDRANQLAVSFPLDVAMGSGRHDLAVVIGPLGSVLVLV